MGSNIEKRMGSNFDRFLQEKLMEPKEDLIEELKKEIGDPEVISVIEKEGGFKRMFRSDLSDHILTLQEVKKNKKYFTLLLKSVKKEGFLFTMALDGIDSFIQAETPVGLVEQLVKNMAYAKEDAVDILTLSSSMALHFKKEIPGILNFLVLWVSQKREIPFFSRFRDIYFRAIVTMPEKMKNRILKALLEETKKNKTLFEIITALNKVLLKFVYTPKLEQTIQSKEFEHVAKEFTAKLETGVLKTKDFACVATGSVEKRLAAFDSDDTDAPIDIDLMIIIFGHAFNKTIIKTLEKDAKMLQEASNLKIDLERVVFFPGLKNITIENYKKFTEEYYESALKHFLVPYYLLKGDLNTVEHIFDIARRLNKINRQDWPGLFWERKN